jgi:hypothetical protein
MTRAKRPLPTLRFVVIGRDGKVLYRLIPQTTPKGNVLPDLWAMPGERIVNTADLAKRCRRYGWRYRIEGDTGSRRKS